MGGITSARVLAPLALVAAVVALVLVVQGSKSDPSPSPAAETTTQTTPKKQAGRKRSGSRKKAGKARTYTVAPGDTLGAIAAKTGVSVAVIEELNPGLDPTAMTVGQKLKLAP